MPAVPSAGTWAPEHGAWPPAAGGFCLAGPIPAEPLGPGALVGRAATVIQAHWRGHLSRRRGWTRAQGLLALLRRQPGMAGLRAPRAPRKRPAPTQASAQAAPAQMDERQRMQRLKLLFAPQWQAATHAVDGRHPQVMAHFGDKTPTADQLRRVVAQKREDAFAAALPDDACHRAGFFSAARPRLTVRGRRFEAPTGDLDMQEAAPLAKKTRRA